MDTEQNKTKTAKQDKPQSVSENGQTIAQNSPHTVTENSDPAAKQKPSAQQIRFANDHQAQLVVLPPDTGATEMLSGLTIQPPDAVFLLIGGSNDEGEDFFSQPIEPVRKTVNRSRRQKSPSPLDLIADSSDKDAGNNLSRKTYLAQFFSRGIAQTAVNVNAAIIDDGRQSGISALMGDGVAYRDHQCLLIGVAPASQIAYPGSTTDSGKQDVEPLDPNHTHFILTEGQNLGDGTKIMFQLAAALANMTSGARSERKPVITLLLNGGSLAKRQLLYSVRQGWPIVVITGTGHLADELAGLWKNTPDFIPDPALSEIIDEGKLYFLELREAINKFEQLTKQLLSYHQTHITQFELRELTPQTIQFANKRKARLVASQSDTDPKEILTALGIKYPGPALLLLGGSSELNEAMAKFSFGTSDKFSYVERRSENIKKRGQKPEFSKEVLDNIYDILIDADQDGSVPTVHSISMDALAKLTQLLRLGIGSTLANKDIVILDNGRQSDVTALMGQAMVQQKEQRFDLLGVTPASKVTYPGGPPAGSLKDGTPLDPHHTHFVLTEGEQWGDETDMMYQLASTLARQGTETPTGIKNGRSGTKDNLVATILINGDFATKKQLIYSVQRDWPIIIIKGSGGLADELAQLRENRPKFISDPDLAEIITNGKLHLFDIDRPAVEFEAVLARLLNEQRLRHHQADMTSIEFAWKQFGTFDAAANGQQRDFRRLQIWMLVLGVLGTFLALSKQTMEHTDPIKAFLGFYYQWIDNILFYIILVIPIMIAALAAAFNEFSNGKKWILLRASAESIKKEIYRYRAKSDIYSDSATTNISREVKLGRRINTIQANLMTGEAKLAALPDYNGPIPPIYAAHSEDDGLGFLTPDRYLPLRLADQYDYYKGKTIKLQKQLERLQWIIYIVGGAGTLLVALGLELWIALTTALVTAFTTYLEYQQVENTLIRYNKTATDLNRIMVWWEALSVEEQADPKNVDKLVERTETVIHSEHAAWVQEMQDVIDEFAQQEEDEDDQKKKEKESKSKQETEEDVEDLIKLFEDEEIEEEIKAAQAVSEEDEEQVEVSPTISSKTKVTSSGSTAVKDTETNS